MLISNVISTEAGKVRNRSLFYTVVSNTAIPVAYKECFFVISLIICHGSFIDLVHHIILILYEKIQHFFLLVKNS